MIYMLMLYQFKCQRLHGGNKAFLFPAFYNICGVAII